MASTALERLGAQFVEKVSKLVIHKYEKLNMEEVEDKLKIQRQYSNLGRNDEIEDDEEGGDIYEEIKEISDKKKLFRRKSALVTLTSNLSASPKNTELMEFHRAALDSGSPHQM